MDWRDWECFCLVVDHRGFGAAARALGRPKSSLSAAVARLEAALGLRLLERSTRHLRMTEPGEEVYRRARPLLRSLRDVGQDVAARAGGVSGTLRIKAPYEFGAHHIGPVACTLMREFPDLAIRIDVEHEIVHPAAENYDIVFVMGDTPTTSPGIVIRKVFTVERGLFASPGFLARHGEPRDVAALSRLPLLTGAGDTAWRFTTEDGEEEVMPLAHSRLVSSNAHVRLQAAVAGQGVLRVTASYTKDAVAAARLRRILPAYVCEPLTVYALLPSRRLVAEKVRHLLLALERHVHAEARAA